MSLANFAKDLVTQGTTAIYGEKKHKKKTQEPASSIILWYGAIRKQNLVIYRSPNAAEMFLKALQK